ncbi:MAG: PIG-L family deacetylase [Methanobacteriota archaeon]
MKILAFGAHPDDLEVGMGATIAKHSDSGDEVLMVVALIPNNPSERLKESENAAKILGAKVKFLDIKPDEFSNNRRIVEKFDEIVQEFKPDIIYTHWIHDSHQDHITVGNATLAAARRNTCSVYMYEQTIPGGIVPYGFKPQMFIDVSSVIDKKIESVLSHKSQIDANGDNWVYGIKGRAQYRGYQINTKFAEAFEVVKEIKAI